MFGERNSGEDLTEMPEKHDRLADHLAVRALRHLPQLVTASADGSTSEIKANHGFVRVTSSNGDHIAKLPPGDDVENIGMVIRGWVGANGFELQTPDDSDATINGVDADGTNEAAIPATSLFRVTLVAVDTWVLEVLTELGADAAAVVPD